MRDDSADVCLRLAIRELVYASRHIGEEEDKEKMLCHVRLIKDIEALIRTLRRIRNGEGYY